MRILITGSNGLLGQKLCLLLSKNREVEFLATSRGEDRGSGVFPYASMDITKAKEVEEVIGRFRPDVVIHAAAQTQVDDCELHPQACDLVNVTATKHIIEACNQVGAFLLYISTDFIFDGEEGPYDEMAIPKPVNHYGWSKLEAEKLVQAQSKSWAIARTVLVYGFVKGLSRSNIVLWVKESLEQGKTIKVVDDQWRSPTLAEDLADGCARIAQNKAGGIWNLSGPDFMSPYEMALKVAEVFQLNKTNILRADSSTFSQPARRPPKTGFIIEKAKAALGYHPHSFIDGLSLVKEQIFSR
jgi:dTDP-4-dehydrorhamnose reductase